MFVVPQPTLWRARRCRNHQDLILLCNHQDLTLLRNHHDLILRFATAGHLFPMSVPGAAVPKPLMNKTAMIATQMKMRIEIAEPIPRFSALNRLS